MYNQIKLVTSLQKNIYSKLPILGQQVYLESKSSEFGWLISDDFVIAFFLDRRFIFSRIVFSIAPYLHSENREADESNFLNNVVKYIKEQKLCDFVYKAQSNVVFNSCPFSAVCVPWGTYEVSLDKSEEELFSSFNQKSRNVIRKAIRSGVQIEQSKNVEVIFKNIKETLERQNSVHYPSLDYLKKIGELQNNVAFFVSKKDDVIQGSLVLLYDETKGYAMYAGSIKKPITGSLDLLHYEAMKFLQNKNVKLYDFVGTRIHIKKGSKQEGIDRFKRKFNPDLVQGYAFMVVVKPLKYFLYSVFSGFYFKLKGISYIDPITEIADEEKCNKLLLMGPRYMKKDKSMVSGTIILFENLIHELKKNNTFFEVIDTNKYNYPSYKLGYFYIIMELLKKAGSTDTIILNSSQDYMVYSPILLFYQKIFEKRIILRKFGGEAQKVYTSANSIKQKYLSYIFHNINILFFETKYLVSFFSKINKNSFWFPNVRERLISPSIPRTYNKRFVFISHVVKAKGIEEILEASKRLDSSYTIDIYGPIIHHEFTKDDFSGYQNLSYKGAIESHKVLEVLNTYDGVLLPSYKEGYPGIIIEAYSLGMPVITTNLESIMEIVDDYETGILVPPKNVNKLYEAIKYFNQENYAAMSGKAYKKFDEFDSKKVSKLFFDQIK